MRLSLNPTTPLPESFADTEPALLTRAEFLEMRDPQSKTHSSDAYPTTMESLNRFAGWVVGSDQLRDGKVYVYATDSESDDLVFRDENGAALAVLHQGSLYRDRFSKIPTHYIDNRSRELVRIDVATETEVKYPEEYVRLVYDVVSRNRESFPLVLRRFTVGDERFELRAEREPRPNKRDNIVIMNDEGMIVAMGSDEWGASLLTVAKEYRGRGLGRMLAEAWYEFNPRSKSGGFTPSGYANAISTWAARVHEFLARGWYSAMVRAGVLTQERVDQILSGLGGRRIKPAPVPEPRDESPSDLRVYVMDDVGFVLYDARFLEDPSEEHIYAHGFLRESTSTGPYFYRLDYDPKYKRLATAIGLQLARDAGDAVYVAAAPGDIVEWELVPDAFIEDGRVALLRDVLPLKALAAHERAARKPVDPHKELENSLLEMADAKWR